MPSMENVNSDSLFTMLKGEPGLRKSTAALSYPTPQYWFDIDDKIEAMRLPMKNFGINPKDIHFDKYNKPNSANDVIKKLESLQVNCPYKTVVLDSVTSEAQLINRQTLKMKSGTTNQSGGEKGIRIAGIPVNSIEDYKAEASHFNEIIALLKDIKQFHKINVILIAHVIASRKDNEENPLTHHSRIIITGGKAISGMIPVFCTEVYHFNIDNDVDISKGGHYGIFTEHTGNDYARTSLPLERKIIFDNKPLYETYILPAIKKLDNQIPIEKPTLTIK